MNNQFFIVGAQRSGTTYLYNILDEHPEICMAKPVKPEPKYFLQDQIDLKYYYDKFYNHKDNQIKIYGEKSTSYYENEEVAKKLAKYFSNAKIIFILANPVDRAISNYKFSYENGLEKRNLEEVFLSDKKIDTNYNTSVNPFAYKERGLYYKYLEYYYKYFPSNNIKIILKEEFIGNIKEIKSLFTFLNVDSSYIPKVRNKIINKSNVYIDKTYIYKIQNKLKMYFHFYNQILEKKYNLNIDIWNK